MMRFYNGRHRYYCGVDLHTKWMYLYILDPGRPGRRRRVHVHLVLARRPLPGREDHVRARPRAVHEGHSWWQEERRQARQREDRSAHTWRHVPAELRLPVRDAGRPQPRAAQDILWCVAAVNCWDMCSSSTSSTTSMNGR